MMSKARSLIAEKCKKLVTFIKRKKIIFMAAVPILVVSATIAIIIVVNNETAEVQTIKYVVAKFETAGGLAVAEQKIVKGGIATKPADPTKPGFVFVEWQFNGQKYNFDKPIAADTIITAVWRDDGVGIKYTVTFDSAGGSTVAPILVLQNNAITAPINPTKSGYVFAGWNDGNTSWAFKNLINKDMTLTAKWEKLSVVSTAGHTSTATSTSATTGTNTSGNSSGNGGGSTVNTTVTNHTISFMSIDAGGSRMVSSNQSIEPGGLIVRPPDPIREGWSFQYWSLDGKEFDFLKKVYSDVVIESVWIDATITGSNDPSCFPHSASGGFATITGYTCTSFGSTVYIPSSISGAAVTSIGENAFRDKNIYSVVLPAGISSIGNGAFCMNKLSSISIPAGLTTISNGAFCSNNFSSITIPAGVTAIGESAFAGNKLTSIVIPNGVVSIGYAALAYNQLTTITIPASVTSIGQYSLMSNPYLTTIINQTGRAFEWRKAFLNTYAESFETGRLAADTEGQFVDVVK